MSYGYFPNSSICGYGMGGGLFASVPFQVPNWANINPINNLFPWNVPWNANPFAFGNPCNTFGANNAINPLNTINYAPRSSPINKARAVDLTSSGRSPLLSTIASRISAKLFATSS